LSDDLISVLGGRQAVGDVVEDLYRLIGDDPLLAPVFAGYDVFRIQRHMHDFLVAAAGGADDYSGRPLHLSHEGLGITDEMFDRTVGHVQTALRAHHVADPHVVAVLEMLGPVRTAVVGSAPEPTGVRSGADRAAAALAFSHTLHLSSLVSCWRAFAAAHAGEVVVSPRFIASRVPGHPVLDRAIVLDPAAVDPVLDVYDGTPGVAVWTRPEDDGSAEKLGAAGFVRGRRTTTMTGRLHDATPDPHPVAIDARADPTVVVQLSGASPELVRNVEGLTAYATADHASGLLVFRSGTDVVVSYLATEPGRRRHGLATSLLRQALVDLRRRGIRTASLQADPVTEGLSRQLGFERLGGWQQWVRAA
jgi:hemoglobin